MGLRADSAYYTGAVVSAARRAGARFSITVSANRGVRKAITGIAEAAWMSIRYPNAVWDEEGQCPISDAQVAETTYTAFAGTRHQVTARLVVRRVRRLDRQLNAGQGELLAGWRYHAFLTDTTFTTVAADLTHRAHAVIEQVFADLISGPLAHCPSGHFGANGAWLLSRGHRAQPAARRRHADRPDRRPGPRCHPAPPDRQRRRPPRPPRPRHRPAPTRALALGRSPAAAVRHHPPAPAGLSRPHLTFTGAAISDTQRPRGPHPHPIPEQPSRTSRKIVTG